MIWDEFERDWEEINWIEQVYTIPLRIFFFLNEKGSRAMEWQLKEEMVREMGMGRVSILDNEIMMFVYK